MKHLPRLIAALLLLGVTATAHATPSTVVWAPSTTYTQPFMVPHLTYDTYFRNSASYPTDVGLTMGVSPSEAVQAELGFDLFYPSNDPLFLNGKVTLVEDKLFGWQPALSIGIANAGITSNTNYGMIYGILGKTIAELGGVTLGAGVGYGLDSKLYVDETGKEDQTMFIGSIATPAFKVGLPWLAGIGLAADVQTGSNLYSAAGAALNFLFTPSIGLLTGPVFFLNDKVQPNGSSWMWTMQIDVDIPSLLTNRK